MYKRERQGTCSFTYIELFDDVEKAANPKEKGKFVECKVSDVRFCLLYTSDAADE